MTLEELTNEELLELYKAAIADLPGGGAKGRAWLADIEEELFERLGGKE